MDAKGLKMSGSFSMFFWRPPQCISSSFFSLIHGHQPSLTERLDANDAVLTQIRKRGFHPSGEGMLGYVVSRSEVPKVGG